MSDPSSFALSRIYAEGWKAARKSLSESASGEAPTADSLNPYGADPERARWGAGFEAALQQRPRGR